jgi:hypothetical protein
MKRVLALVVAVLALGGCRQAGTPTDPFFGRTTVPPPGTGAVAPRPGDPYYQPPPAGGPLQPIPQPQPLTVAPPSTPGPASAYGRSTMPGTTPTYPAANSGRTISPSATPPGYSPSPAPSYPPSTTPSYPPSTPPAGGGYPSSPGYAPPGGFTYNGAAAARPASDSWTTPVARTSADSRDAGSGSSAPGVIRVPSGDGFARSADPGSYGSAALSGSPAETVASRTSIVRTLEPRAKDAGGASSVGGDPAGSRALPSTPPVSPAATSPRASTDIMDLPPAQKD